MLDFHVYLLTLINIATVCVFLPKPRLFLGSIINFFDALLLLINDKCMFTFTFVLLMLLLCKAGKATRGQPCEPWFGE